MNLPKVKDGDWLTVRRNFQRIDSVLYGVKATPTFEEVTVTLLNADTADLSNITDGNIPYMGTSGFADSLLSYDGTDIYCTGGTFAITRSDAQPKLLVRAPTDTGNGSQAQIELNAGVSSTTRWLIWASSAQDNLVFYDAIDTRYPLILDGDGDATFSDNIYLTKFLDIGEIEVPASPADNHIRLYAVEDDGFTVLEVVDPLGSNYRPCQDSFRVARNMSGTSIAKGKVVYFYDSTGNKPEFALAQSNSETTMPGIGMTIDAVADTEYGRIMIVGKLTGVKTDYATWTEGDELFVDPTTPGELTNVRPTHPNLAQWVGTIEVVHATAGVILVAIQDMLGREDGTNRSSFSIGTSTDKVVISHDTTDAYFKTTDGSFIFQTDEGTNSNTVFELKGKGTGAGYLQVMDEDDAEWIQMNCLAGVGYIGTTGSAPAGIKIMNSAYGNVELFGGSTSGQTRELKVYGYRTSDALRSLEIGVGVDAADSASYDGVSTHFFNENIVVGSSFPSTVSQRFEITDTDRSDMVIHTVNDTVGKTASLSFGVTTGYGSVIQNGSRSVDLVATRNASNVFSLGLYASDGTTNNLVLTLNGNKQATFEGDILFSSGAGLLFGEISVYGNVTADTITTGTYTQVTRFDTNGPSNGTTPDHTNDHITILTSGYYEIIGSISFSGDGSVEWFGSVFKNNGVTQLTNISFQRKLGAAGDIGSASFSGIAYLTANDTIELWVKHAAGVNKDITIADCTLSLVMIGG